VSKGGCRSSTTRRTLRPTVTERRLRGGVLALAVIGGLVALDVAFDTIVITTSYMLGAFVAAIAADLEVTVVIALVALALAIASPAWNGGWGSADYAAKVAIAAFGDLFAIQTARFAQGVRRALGQQRVLTALAGLPTPGATLEGTIDRVTEVLVPRIAAFAAIDALRGDELVRVGSRGTEPPANALVTTELRARGREIGALTVGGAPFRPGQRDFLRVAAGRVALALDNAGLAAELETAEQRVQAILTNLAEAVTVQDTSGRLVFANQAAADLLGADSVEQLLDSDPRALMNGFESFNEDGSPLTADQLPGRHVLAGRTPAPLVVRTVSRRTREERWRMTKTTPVFGADGAVAYAVNVIEDITEAKRSEFAQQLLAEASAVLASSLDYASTLQRVAELAVPELADWCSVSLPRGSAVVQVAAAPADAGDVAPAARRDAAAVLTSGRSKVDERTMLVPLAIPERTIGVIALVRRESGRPFDTGDRALAEELGRRAATAVENARLHTELREVAATLQHSLLPPALPAVPGWSFSSLYRSATGATEVGGDFYDVFPTAAGWMAVIGDVAGRGAAAASLTSMARYTLRTAGSLVGTPTMGLVRLNESLRERGEMALCTAAIVLLREDGEASIVCAGHPLPLFVRDGRPQAVGRTGPLLGAFDHGHWLPAPVAFTAGDLLVLYTDGVLDAVGPGHERFGEERLEQTLGGVRDPDEAVARIDAALNEFAGTERSDDTAVLALMRR
jgi:PAS domain S-box-containing protein